MIIAHSRPCVTKPYSWTDRSSRLFALCAILSAVVAIGCSDDSSSVSGAGGNGSVAGAGGAGKNSLPQALQVEGDRRVPYTPTTDLAFAEFFIGHHQMAIDMAKEEVDRGDDPEVVAMARDVIQAQTAEIETMQRIKSQLSGSVPDMPGDPHADAEMHAAMHASGAELDRLFLLEMIPHHASALPAAHRALSYLQNAELKQLAEQIVMAQADEVGMMHAKLQSIGAIGAGEDLATGTSDRSDFGLIGDRRVPLTPRDDAEFVDFFAPHHQMAIMMADHESAHGKDPDVVSMAKTMEQSQTMEVELMQLKRAQLAGAQPGPAPEDPHATKEMGQMMNMSGAELDRMFLLEMIVHHASALPTSHRAKPHVLDSDLEALADDMFDAQATEIGDMQKMLE